MKIWVAFILLTILCPGGCPVYDFDLKTIDNSNSFNNDLRLEAELNSEIEQGLMNMNSASNGVSPLKYSKNFDEPFENEAFEETTADDPLESKLQRGTCPDTKTEIDHFVGTNLFDGNRKKCFSSEDVALLAARKDFEMLIPKELPQCLLNDEMVGILMQYFYAGNQVIQRMGEDSSKRLTEKAFYDMLGGYLKYYMVPVTKFSFYAGQVNLKTVDNVVALYHQCKVFLNTNGNGWRTPMSNVLNELKNVHVEPLKVALDQESSNEPSSCIHLDLTSINNDAEDDQMIVSLPKLEPEDSDGYLGNIWLPFKRKRTFNLRSGKSAYVVVKFYETVTRCYQFQSTCQDTYNHKFKAWILEYVQVHLSDEQFYPGLGAILRIYENLRRGKKAVEFGLQTDIDNGRGLMEEDEYEDRLTNKRQKSDEFKEIENKSKQMYGKSDNWFEQIYAKQIASRDGTKCKTTVKPSCKPTHKPTENVKVKEKSKKGKKKKPKQKSKEHNKGVSLMPDAATQRKIIKYICYGIALLLLLLLLVLLCTMISKRKKKPKPKGDQPTPPTSPKAKKKRCSFCERFRRKKKKGADEEILIKPDSTSVITSQPARRSSTSTSSLACQPTKKCIPCSKRGGKDSERSDAPVIETTSLDYTSSEPEDKKKKKGKGKNVRIDEKKNTTSPQKKRFGKSKKDSSTTEQSADPGKRASRIGLQRSTAPEPDNEKDNKTGKKGNLTKDKPHQTTSWETVYDT